MYWWLESRHGRNGLTPWQKFIPFQTKKNQLISWNNPFEGSTLLPSPALVRTKTDDFFLISLCFAYFTHAVSKVGTWLLQIDNFLITTFVLLDPWIQYLSSYRFAESIDLAIVNWQKPIFWSSTAINGKTITQKQVSTSNIRPSKYIKMQNL